MKSYTALIFDFDFTLVDASRGIIQSTNLALEQMGHKRVGEEQVKKLIGLPLEVMYKHFVDESYHARNQEFAKKYKENAATIMTRFTELLPSVPEVISVAKKSGLRLGIVSTKTHARIEEVLVKYDLKPYFEIVIGGDDVEEYKPSPMGLRRAMNFFQIPPSQTLYIGDSLTDAKTARNAGVDFVAVLTGTTGGEAFADFTPLQVFPSLAELPKWLLESKLKLK